MNGGPDAEGTDESLAPPPRRPPIEAVEVDGEWVIEEYARGRRTGRTLSRHDDRMAALRAAKERLEEGKYPCLLRWEAPDSVRGLYWNRLYEGLAVRYDELIERWVIVPEAGHFVFAAGDRREPVYERARTVQRRHEFKHLRVYAVDDERVEAERDHRFLRLSIDQPGVTFDPERLAGGSEPDAAERPESGPGSDAEPEPGTAGPGGAGTARDALATAVPDVDVTSVEVEESSGPIQYYRVPWSDEQRARIAMLEPAAAGGAEAAVDAFTSAASGWASISDHPHVATVFDTGTDPAPWLASRPGDGSLAGRMEGLTTDRRLRILGHVAAALQAAADRDVPRRGIEPRHVRLVGDGRATVSDWGVSRAVHGALGNVPVTPYTAPEQLEQAASATTGVYQFGALAYRLLVGTPPFDTERNLRQAIRSEAPSVPSVVSDLPAAVDRALLRALATDPDDRYRRVADCYEAIIEAVR